MRRFRLLRNAVLTFLFTILFSLTLMVGRVEATDGLRGDECVVEDTEIIVRDFYFFCNTLEIRGVIDGDVAGIASEVRITETGRVMGDLWVGGGRLIVEGTMEDDIHFLGIDLDIIGLTRFPHDSSDIVAIGLSMEIAREVVVPGDVIYYGYQAILNSRINGDVDFQGQALIIDNSVAGTVTAVTGDQESNAPLSSLPLLYSVDFQNPGLRFGEAGFINGDLNYKAPQRISITNNVAGIVTYTQAIGQADITKAEQSDTFLQILGNYILKTARDVTALSILGILALNFFSTIILEPSYRVQTRFISAFSWGLILTLLSIPAALLLLVTSAVILGVTAIITLNELTIIVGIMVVVINLGMIGGFFFLLVFVGRVISCFVVGFALVKWTQQFWVRYLGQPPKFLGELWFAVITGVTVISLLVNMPLGAFIGLLQLLLTGTVLFAGLGALFMYIRDLSYVTERRIPFFGRSGLRNIPPPPDDLDDIDLNLPIGMENLPPGFRWFDE